MTQQVMFFKLAKVDVEKRLVYGLATAEVVDKSGEICDYESTKPFFKEWSESFAKATGGLSVGNMRVMHQPQVAGPIKSIDFDDVAKTIMICGHVVDDATWKMVLAGGYTGFSQGGSYVKTWQDPDNAAIRRFTSKPTEVSIVDNPCLGVATFEIIKADGSIELRKFHPTPKDNAMNVEKLFKAKNGETFGTPEEAVTENLRVDAEEAAKNATAGMQKILDELNKKLDTGEYWDSEAYLTKTIPAAEVAKLKDVDANTASIAKKKFSAEKRKQLAGEGKALPDGSFPIEDKEDVKNAVHAHGRAKNPDEAKAHIKARAKTLGAEDSLPDDWKDKSDADKAASIKAGVLALAKSISKRGNFRKSLHDVSRCACLMAELDWMHQCLEMEAACEGDNSDAPAHLMEILRELSVFLVALVEEETQEMLGGEESDMAAILELAVKIPAEEGVAMAKFMIKNCATLSNEKNADRYGKLADAFTKAGARHSKADADHLDKMQGHMKKMTKSMDGMHDCMKGLGMESDSGNTNDKDTADKAALSESLTKANTIAERATAERDAMVKSVNAMTETLSKAMERITALEEQPAVDPKRPSVFSLEKTHGVKKDEKSPDGGERQAVGSRATPSDYR